MSTYPGATYPGDEYPETNLLASTGETIVTSPGGAQWRLLRDVEVEQALAEATSDAASSVAQAGSKNRTYYDFGAPNVNGQTIGDTWRQRADGSDPDIPRGSILGEWEWNGDTWDPRPISSSQITNLDVGKLTVGTAVIDDLVAENIAAATGQFIQLDVGNLVVTGTGEFDELVSETIWSDVIRTRKITADMMLIGAGDNLVPNGTGTHGDNTNFTSFEFDGTDGPTGSRGSFDKEGSATISVNEVMPVDTFRAYRFRYQVKQKNPLLDTTRHYGFIAPHDSTGDAISPMHYMYRPGTTTTLAQPLNQGDTVVHLTSAEHWYNAGGGTFNTLIFWDWEDDNGKVWPEETYSRNVAYNAYDADAVDFTANTITLRDPWTGVPMPAGSPVSNGGSGGSFLYIAASNAIVPNEWTEFTGELKSGVHAQPTTLGASPTAATDKVPPGTAGVKVGWLLAYQGAGVPEGEISRQSVANVSFVAKTDSSLIVDGSISARKIVLTGDPENPDEADFVANVGKILKLEANNFSSNLITGDYIQGGAIRGEHVAAGTITADKVLIGIGSNIVPNPGGHMGDIDWSGFTYVAGNAEGTGYPGSFYAPPNVTTTTRSDTWFPIEGGAEYSMVVWARSSVDVRLFSSGLEFDKGAPIMNWVESFSPAQIGPEWSRYENWRRVPVEATKARVVIKSNDNRYSYGISGQQWFTGITLTKRVSGELIVNGAIDGQSITGAWIGTAVSGQRTEMDPYGFRSFDSLNRPTLEQDSETGAFSIVGRFDSAPWDQAGVSIIPNTGTVHEDGGLFISRIIKARPDDNDAGVWVTRPGEGTHARPLFVRGLNGGGVEIRNGLHTRDGLTVAGAEGLSTDGGGDVLLKRLGGGEISLRSGAWSISSGSDPLLPGILGQSTMLQFQGGGSYLRLRNNSGAVLQADAVYSRTTTSGANVNVDSDGLIKRSSSARRYKDSIETTPQEWAERILELEPRTWFDHGEASRYAEYLNGEDVEPDPGVMRRIPGLVAEEVEAAGLTTYVNYGADGMVEGLEYDRLWTLLIPLVRQQRDQIIDLTARVVELEAADGA